MNVAVVTLTRDRLAYTKHCFAKLHENAGCDFDHYVLDQGSTDGSWDWLSAYGDELENEPYGNTAFVYREDENIGICRGLNKLIEQTKLDDYDVVVKIDNDCELVQPNTLRDVCQLTLDGGAILSPRILGLQNPPAAIRELRIGNEKILDIPQIGSIFMAVPGWVYDEFRYDESQMLFDDVQICHWWRAQGGTCGYVERLEAWHYLSTDGQRADDPGYFVRKDAEYEGVK